MNTMTEEYIPCSFYSPIKLGDTTNKESLRHVDLSLSFKDGYSFKVYDSMTGKELKHLGAIDISTLSKGGNIKCKLVFMDIKVYGIDIPIHTFIHTETVIVDNIQVEPRRITMAQPTKTVQGKPEKTVNGKPQNTMSSGKKGK